MQFGRRQCWFRARVLRVALALALLTLLLPGIRHSKAADADPWNVVCSAKALPGDPSGETEGAGQPGTCAVCGTHSLAPGAAPTAVVSASPTDAMTAVSNASADQGRPGVWRRGCAPPRAPPIVR